MYLTSIPFLFAITLKLIIDIIGKKKSSINETVVKFDENLKVSRVQALIGIFLFTGIIFIMVSAVKLTLFINLPAVLIVSFGGFIATNVKYSLSDIGKSMRGAMAKSFSSIEAAQKAEHIFLNFYTI